MDFDINLKSHQLLEQLANSVYDRNKSSEINFGFNLAEIQIVQQWIMDLLEELGLKDREK